MWAACRPRVSSSAQPHAPLRLTLRVWALSVSPFIVLSVNSTIDARETSRDTAQRRLRRDAQGGEGGSSGQTDRQTEYREPHAAYKKYKAV